MLEHPIPQDITGYKFHIIGDLTLKQFGEIAGGIVIAIIINALGFPGIIKWPFMIFFGGIGFMMAFVPFEERPLDHWIITFVKNIYKPTKFFWRKESKVPDFFLFEKASTTPAFIEPEIDLSPQRRLRMKEYLSSVKATHVSKDAWDSYEENRISLILADFDTVAVSDVQAKQQIIRPDLKIRVRDLKKVGQVQVEKKESQPVKEKVLYKQIQIAKQPLASQTSKKQEPLKIEYQQQAQPEIQYQVPKKEVRPQITLMTQKAVVVPEAQYVSVTPQKSEQAQAIYQTVKAPAEYSTIQIIPEKPQEAVKAAQDVDLPFPSTPKEANRIVGMTIDQQNQSIGEAIIEIKTEQGRIVRAVKSNPLGQFFTTTPLQSGKYFIETEKEGFSFPVLTIVLKNKVVKPIAIRAI